MLDVAAQVRPRSANIDAIRAHNRTAWIQHRPRSGHMGQKTNQDGPTSVIIFKRNSFAFAKLEEYRGGVAFCVPREWKWDFHASCI